jgi:hypothetical protein
MAGHYLCTAAIGTTLRAPLSPLLLSLLLLPL